MRSQLGSASADWDGKRLTVTTGHVERMWHLYTGGLTTVSLRRLDNAGGGRQWILPDRLSEKRPDWRIRGYEPSMGRAELVDVGIFQSTGAVGTSDSITAVVELTYREANLGLRYWVDAYPGAPGLRTQLSLRLLASLPNEEVPGSMENSTVETLAMDLDGVERCAAGYYNDPQHRNHDDTPILKEETRTGAIDRREIYDWANLLILRSSSQAGLVLVKESHKCVNQLGLDTGAFVLDGEGVRVTGLGLNNAPYAWYHKEGAHSLGTDYQSCWATWTILYHGGHDEAILALKQFDRARFHPVPDADRLVRANTWGTRFDPGLGGQNAATEENVKREIDSCVELGVEHLTIDAGWDKSYPPAGTDRGDTPYHPHPDRFPDGFAPIREYASEKGILLGLHFGVTTPLADMIRNFEDGGFASFKLDFGSYVTRRQLDEVIAKAEGLRERGGEALRVSWDLTENSPRIGYFLAREYGTLYPENRRTVPIRRITHVAYTPRLVLRDLWHFAHYLNTNAIEMPVNIPSRIDPLYSNASEYPIDYCFAITMMAVPLLFMETQFLPEADRELLRPIITLYREHRDAMRKGYVFPVGDEADDRSWTGFQSYDPETGDGYLLVFREVYNGEARRRIGVRFVSAATITLIDLVSGTEEKTQINADGTVEFEMPDAPSYRFLRYSVPR